MWSFSKRLAAFCCASLTASAALLSADNADNYDYSSNYYNGSSYYDGSNSNGECCDSSNWSFGADFLYWKAHVDNLPSSSIVNTNNVPGTVDVGAGAVDVLISQSRTVTTKYPHCRWRPGVRLNLGYKQPDCAWDLDATWTYLYSRARAAQSVSATAEGTATSVLVTGWPSGLTSPVGLFGDSSATVSGYVAGKWSLNYNVFEIGLGQSYSACECFVLRPHFDLKLAWIKQRYSSYFYRNVAATAVAANGTSTAVSGLLIETVNAKRHFTGVGPQLGFDISWDIGCGLNLYGKATAAILYARPKINHNASIAVDDATVPGLDLVSNASGNGHHRNHNGHLYYNTFLGGGLGWNSWFWDNSYFTSVKLGWEHHLYFDQNNFHRSGNISFSEEKGALALYGLTASVGIDF